VRERKEGDKGKIRRVRRCTTVNVKCAGCATTNVQYAEIIGAHTTQERQHIPEYFAAEVERRKKASRRECRKGKGRR
jgi:hypothetical protein